MLRTQTRFKAGTFQANFGKTVIDIVFLYEHKKGLATVLEPEELDSVIWLTIDEILAHEKVREYTKES